MGRTRLSNIDNMTPEIKAGLFKIMAILLENKTGGLTLNRTSLVTEWVYQKDENLFEILETKRIFLT